jgi:hypothetical protein
MHIVQLIERITIDRKGGEVVTPQDVLAVGRRVYEVINVLVSAGIINRRIATAADGLIVSLVSGGELKRGNKILVWRGVPDHISYRDIGAAPAEPTPARRGRERIPLLGPEREAALGLIQFSKGDRTPSPDTKAAALALIGLSTSSSGRPRTVREGAVERLREAARVTTSEHKRRKYYKLMRALS